MAVTSNGAGLYVADMNSDSVSVLIAATLKVTGTIAVGRLPMSVAVSPDGSQAWVGNGLPPAPHGTPPAAEHSVW